MVRVTPQVWQPKSLEEAWDLGRSLGSGASYVSGGTWLQIQWRAGSLPRPGHLIRLDSIPELYERSKLHPPGDREPGAAPTGRPSGSGAELFRIGGMTPLAALRSDAGWGRLFPALPSACRRIAAPAVRELATVAGNLMTAGDLTPAFVAMRAQLVWFTEGMRVRQSLEDWLQGGGAAGSGQGADPAAILAAVEIPPGALGGETFYVKLTRRDTFVPAVVTVAGWLVRDEDGGVREAVLAVGGAGVRPGRLRRAESCLKGGALWDDRVLLSTAQAVWEEFAPKGDTFSSADYCRRAASNLIIRELIKMRDPSQGGGQSAATQS
ncbi:MAG TPA: hypothetical protein GX517_12710 [Alicyclobacillus sp.]|nr:hypothetical protein [Alicyclobacillus sp.]